MSDHSTNDATPPDPRRADPRRARKEAGPATDNDSDSQNPTPQTDAPVPPKTGADVRTLCRSGDWDRPTAGLAPGYSQANLVVLRADAAADFEAFCRLNPKPCPLIEVTKPGNYEPTQSAPGADLRTDLTRYRVFHHGQCTARPTTIIDLWESDFVAFLIGCSFTFDAALLAAGVPIRHVEENRNVPMFRTNRPCTPAGPFHGPLVVSMRPMTVEQAQRATDVTTPMENFHGAPVHIGDPTALGISALDRPDYGDAVTIYPGELPVFWACGVTPMEAIFRAKPDIAITHDPGHMFVTDLLDRDMAGL